jgi:pantetheine-phosphate adenylyltransferase
MRQSACLYPGSFDPVTLGHLDIITRAAGIFERVVVGVLVNAEKKGAFPMEERVAMLKKAAADLPQVEVLPFSGLTVDLCRQLDIRVLVRGLRGPGDLESEMRMAKVNGLLLPGLETVFLPSAGGMEALSSSLVREIASLGGDISALVPRSVLPDILSHYK